MQDSQSRAMGEWLKKYGAAIYGTRGGPYRNGSWGGSCHQDDKLFLHVYQWQTRGLAFDPLPYKVKSARTLTGAAVQFAQKDNEFTVQVAAADRDTPVTVIELTLDQPVEDGRIIGGAREVAENLSEYGQVLSANARLELSSGSVHDNAADHERLFKGEKAGRGFAFHTGDEKNPWAKIDLGTVKNVKAVVIENRPNEHRTDGLILSVSEDGQKWEKAWEAKAWEQKWLVPVTRFHAGIEAPGRPVRYLKVETKGDQPRPMLLQRFTVYGGD